MSTSLIEFEDDILIGDGGIIASPRKFRSIETWTLPDFIEDMKSWADEIPTRESGYRDLRTILLNQYKGLATWLEYYLLEKCDLEERLYSDVYLCNLKPYADLLAASHDFIKRQFYPRQRDILYDIAPTHHHLWAFFVYSLFSRQLQEKLEVDNKAPKTKTDLLKRLNLSIHTQQEYLKNFEREQNYLTSKLFINGGANSINIRLASKIPDYPQYYKKHLNHQEYPVNKIFGLIMLQSQKLSVEDSTFRMHFNNYLEQWNIYRNTVKNSPCFQVCSLMPDSTLVTSKRGRPKKSKRPIGRPPKGQSKL